LWITGVIIWLVGIAATGYAAFLFALSKLALAIILGVGPIFVLLIMFEPTKRFFDAWIGQALNYVFMVMLTAAAVKLVMSILKIYLEAPGVQAALADPAINQALPPIVFSIIGFLVMMQVPTIASSLGGGAAIGTLGAVAWAYGKTKGGISSMRPTNLRRSINKAKSDVRIASNAGKAAAAAPMAVYRKITGGTRNRVSRG
jgi:type IV secretion system protein VirB6